MAVHQILGMERHGFADFRVTTPEGGHLDAAGKIDAGIAIDVRKGDAMSPLKDNRTKCNLAGVTNHVAHPAGTELLGFRSGNRFRSQYEARRLYLSRPRREPKLTCHYPPDLCKSDQLIE